MSEILDGIEGAVLWEGKKGEDAKGEAGLRTGEKDVGRLGEDQEWETSSANRMCREQRKKKERSQRKLYTT